MGYVVIWGLLVLGLVVIFICIVLSFSNIVGSVLGMVLLSFREFRNSEGRGGEGKG